jgi:hypothetical protein
MPTVSEPRPAAPSSLSSRNSIGMLLPLVGEAPKGCDMDRREWLLERRAAVEGSYDVEAPSYE